MDVDAVQWLLSLSFRQLLTRYCVVLGARPSELAKTGCNYGMLVYIGNHILEWMQNGWDKKHMLHHNIDKLWKILWFWLGPGYRQKDLRVDPAVWSLVAMLSSCLALRSLHVAASQNKLHRIMRVLPSAVQSSLLRGSFNNASWHSWCEQTLQW